MHFLIIGTVWFWILAITVGIIIIYSLEHALTETSEDTGGGLFSTIVIIIGLVLYYFFGSKDHILFILDFIKEKPLMLLALIGGYGVIGLFWSLGKWYYFLKKSHKKMIKDLNGKYEDHWRNKTPKAKDHKNKIITWMMYWPFSGIWTMIDEPVIKFFRFIFDRTSKIFDRLSDNMFKDIDQKFVEAAAKKESKDKG